MTWNPRSDSSSPARSATNLSTVSGRGSPRLRWEIHSTHRLALRRCLPLTRRQGSTIRSTGRWRAARGLSSAGSAPLRRQRLFRAHYLDECREGDTCVRRRTLRTGGGRDDSPRRRDRDRSRQRHQIRPRAARSTRAISSAGGASRIKLTPAWSTSTTRPGSMRTCLSAASRNRDTVEKRDRSAYRSS